jgi:SAM-dependent methyltransferase
VLTGSLAELSPWPDELLGHPPDVRPDGSGLTPRLRLCHPSGVGEVVALPVGRWHGPVPPEELRVLARAESPVLDVGCGPGRHVAALIEAGHAALGIDVSAAAVRSARRRGVPAARVSVFADVPGAGDWATALLLDGNIGIGGDPVLLLSRVHALLTPGGIALVELDPPGVKAGRFHARVEHAGGVGFNFAWARVGPDQIGALAARSRFAIAALWEEAGRWFVQLDRVGRGRRHLGRGRGQR